MNFPAILVVESNFSLHCFDFPLPSIVWLITMFSILQNDRLVEAFGSAKQKRAVSARKKNLIDKEEISSKIREVAENIDLPADSQISQGSY